MKRIFPPVLSFVFLFCLFAVPSVCAEDLCMDGTLLFREDFGGNSPDDPSVGTAPVSGMSSDYTQIYKLQTSDAGENMGAGCYLVAKRGYRNSTNPNYSVWHIMDDHTHFGDTTRGYLLEIDGRGSGNDVFYSTVIDGLCEGSRLTFSAYVANLTTAGQYSAWIDRAYVHPKLTFVLTHPETGEELARHNTDTIGHDWENYPKTWQETANWQLVGMNFTVPEGIDAVRLSIRNNASGSSTGNDFAMDDIEIHLCLPKPSIVSDNLLCQNSSYTFAVDFANDGTLDEPLEYKWYYSADSLTWVEKSDFIGINPSIETLDFADAGWYKIAIAGAGNIDRVNCRAMSDPFRLEVKECLPPVPPQQELCMDGTLLFREDFGGNSPDDAPMSMESVPGMDPSYVNSGNSLGSGNYTIRKEGWSNGIQWYRQDDHTYPDDKTRGYLLEVDGIGGETPFYSKTIEDLCAGYTLTFSAYVVNVHYAGQIQWFYDNNRTYVFPRLKFVLVNPLTGEKLASQSTGDIQPDWTEDWVTARTNLVSAEWQLVGMNFTVPEGIESIQMFIYNDVENNGAGNDFALDDIEIRLCLPKPSIVSDNLPCQNSSYTFAVDFANDGTLDEPLEYKWYYSADSLTWVEKSDFIGINPSIETLDFADAGWYKIAVAGAGNIDRVNCRAMSDPFRLEVKECLPPAPPQQDLCMDGILLFREDFGGNSPDDPRVVTTPTPVPGMKYAQLLDDTFGSMRSGVYLLTKQGYCNGDTLPTNPYRGSQWHLQDDHTYPDDVTRGYLMEIDGRGDNAAFYQKTIDGLCEGSQLTFSAYVANVMTWVQYESSPGKFAYPRMKFVLTNPLDNTELASYDTGDIPFDSAFIGDYKCWMYSSKWHLVGMNFTVPEGLNSVTLTIYNNATGTTGNDFAIDDIEIRLCVPPVRIVSPEQVCEDEPYAFEVEIDNDGSLPEPFEYQWFFSSDSLTWTKVPDSNVRNLSFEKTTSDKTGWYKVTVAGEGNIDQENCRTESEPFRLEVEKCSRCERIIVNKYNWVLLIDNVAVRELFPDRTVMGYQWYKNGEPVAGATEDDYSEENELHGVFQMILTLDGDEEVCSNIIELLDEIEEIQPASMRLYNSNGRLLKEWETEDVDETLLLPQGIYFLRIEQGKEVLTRKIYIP